MDNYNGLGSYAGPQNTKNLKFRPLYKANENSILELMDYYFPWLEKGDYISITQRILQSKISLNQLEYISEKLLPHLKIIWSRVNKKPTQTNLLDYAIECFIDNNWDSSEKDIERIKIIAELQKATSGTKQFNYSQDFEQAIAIEHYFFSELYYFPINEDLSKDILIEIDFETFIKEKNDLLEKSKSEEDKALEDDDLSK